MCPFEVFWLIVSRELRWISWTRILVCHHGPVFSNLIFFSAVLSKLMCISVFRLSSKPSNSFIILFIPLLCSLGCPNLVQIVWFLQHAVVDMFSFHITTLAGRISFRYFGISCFVCIVLPLINIFLIFLLSAVLYGLFPQVVFLLFLMLPFPFSPICSVVVSFLLWFLPIFIDFLSTFSVEFPILVLVFLFVFFEGIPIFSQTKFTLA